MSYRSSLFTPPSHEYALVSNKLINRHDDVMLRHVAVSFDGKRLDLLVRVINKAARKKRLQRASSTHSSSMVNGIEGLYDEIEIREQLRHPNILSLFAVRDTQPCILLCMHMESL